MTQESVTVLFADVVGSPSELIEDIADEVRSAYLSVVHETVVAAGGAVMKSPGDRLMGVFRSSSAALDCAVTMQRLVGEVSTRDQPGFGLRVGLSCGEVVRGGDVYFGDQVIEATHLCSRANVGQILATERLLNLARRPQEHPIRSLGTLELSGLSNAVPSVEVVWDHPVPNEPIVGPALVEIDGEKFEVTATRSLVFGRASKDGVVGLDENDMGISAVAGSVEWQWGLWWIVNRSRKRPLLLDDGVAGAPGQLKCGHRFALNTTQLTVLVPGEIFTHRVDITVPESDLARAENTYQSSGTLPAGDLRLTERDKDALVALFSGYLEAFPRRSSHPLTYREAAEELGPAWSPVTVRKQVERVKERARRSGLYFEGAHANHDLADYVIANALLVPADLARLRTQRDFYT